eukprot:446724_1
MGGCFSSNHSSRLIGDAQPNDRDQPILSIDVIPNDKLANGNPHASMQNASQSAEVRKFLSHNTILILAIIGYLLFFATLITAVMLYRSQGQANSGGPQEAMGGNVALENLKKQFSQYKAKHPEDITKDSRVQLETQKNKFRNVLVKIKEDID